LDSDELTSLEFAPEDSSIESDTNLDELLGSASLTSDLNSSEDSNRLDDVSSDDIDALFDSVTTSDDAADFMFTDEAADIAEGIPDSLLNDLSDELGSESLSINDDSSSSAQELIEELNDASDENLSQAIDLTELETTDDDDASLQDAFSELEELDLGDAGESFDTSGGGNELSELNELDLDLDVEESGIPASLIDDSNQSIEDQLNIESTDVDAELNHPTDDQPVSNELLDLGEMDLDPLSSAGALEQSDDTSEVNVEADPEVIPQESITQEVTTGDLNDLDSLLSNELDTSLSSDESLEDINSLLSESDSQFSQEGGEFDELNTLLSNPSEPLTDITVPDAVHQADELSAPEENFDDLEALLDEPSELQITTSDSPALDNPAFVSIGDDSDFSDLEKLLEDADQTLAAPPSAKASRGISPVSNRRPVRRGGGGFADQTMRVSIKNLDNLNNLVGELVVNRNSLEQSQERLRQFLDNLLYQVQQLSDVGQRMRDLYERSLLESSLLSSRRSYQMANQAGGDIVDATDTSHATGASFDALEMDRFTGFHTLSQEMIELIVRVREAASDIDFVIDESDQTTRMFRQVTTQLQEGLTRSRMVPFAQAASRLPRAVRDISIKCGKQAELKVEGKDTLIDKMILEQLYDPMTHLVNNAITHGIETPEERHALNKPPVGNITIRVFHQGNQTIISVTDDGAGINPDNVKAKALQRGLISQEEATEMSRLDVYDLLFHHGFSTRDQADDFAGRGVGMDVVRTSLSEIRGVINIDSTVGQGTTFTIRLPLTLSISKALLCVSNRARIAFPMDGVEDMLDVPSDRIQKNEAGKPCIYWRDIVLPFYPLSELLKYNRMLGRGSVYGGSQEDDVISVVVLRSAGNYLALQVDQVLGEQEIVIKQLEAPIPKPAGIAGATVLGDGRIMPIADVLELIDLSMGRIRKEVGSSLWEQEAARIASADSVEVKSEPTVLIVDDSITVRELLSMTFNKVGYRVEQARDGQEAWEKLKSGLPCELVFCDIEMPRMDGLELLSRLQKDPNLKNLPIAMLTSRGADRHRQMAVQLGAKGYFTKPYLEEVLLDAAQRMLNGEVLIGNA
ncbi:MAG: response regulator, partial [Cyanobacteria bacterium J06626_14]